MTIQTKYDIGDTVWLLDKNKVISGEVKKIDLVIASDSCHEVCAVALDRVHQFHVSYLFPSKQALLESL